MDTISLYKHRIDSLMDILFGAGVSNPQTIIEQLNYLLFLRALSIKDDEAELLGITDESEKIFTDDLSKYRWQNLLALNAEDLFKTLEASFDVLQKKSKNSTVKLLFRNAHIKIFDKPTLRRVLHEIEMFAKELDAIAHEGNKDVFGDMYEYLLSKLSSAGTNGQFRTPRHIIDFMVKVVDPKKNETILDPACGTAGFLVAAYRHIAGEYTSEKLKKAGSPRAMDRLSADEKQFLFNHMFTGFDSDEDMIKFGMMNLHLHGLTKSHLARQNSLTDTTGMKDKFDVILANPPFSGKIDEESVSEDLRMGTKATELLFLRFMLDHLSLKGKLAVIVPEGVVFNASKAHTKIRQMLIEKGLWAVVSLPSGAFNPYSGVKTSLLFVDREIAKTKEELLFIKIGNDGFDLGAQRRPVENSDLPAALEVLDEWRSNKKTEAGFATWIPKVDVLSSQDINLSGDRYRTSMDYSTAKWPVVSLGEIAEVVAGQSPEGKFYNEKGDGTPFYQGKTEFGDVYLGEPTKWTTRVTKLAEPGDILMSVRAPVGPVNITRNGICIGRGLAAIRSKKVESLFLFNYLKAIEDQIVGNGGAVFDSINKKQIEEIKVPLPPMEVQKQIVAELGGYQKVIDGAKQVVENWKPRIDIDPEWDRVKLGDIAEYFIGLTYSPENVSDKGTIVLRSSNVQGGKLDFSDIVRVNKKINEKLILRDNDILMCSRNGSKRLVGKIAVIKEPTEKMTFGTFMTVIRSDYGQFLSYFFVSDTFRNQIDGSETSSINQITKYMLDNIVVPFPPIDVQKQIVDRLETERVSVDAAAKLIPIFEQKIRDRIAKLWSA